MKKEIILKILDSLERESKWLDGTELELDKEQYGEILEIMLEAGLITNVKVQRAGQGNKVYVIFATNPRITLRGIEYLEQNNK